MTPTGWITFQVSKPGSFGWAKYGQSVALSNGSALSASHMPMSAGVFYFRALYGGDKYHTPSRSGYRAEKFTVNKADSTTTTQLSDTSIALGNYVFDTATVAGLGGKFPKLTGTVDFEVSNDGGVTWATYDGGEALTGGVATSSAYEPLSPGAYLFRAVYNGDANYKPSESGEQDEPLTVTDGPG
jgi:hypothetical protein